MGKSWCGTCGREINTTDGTCSRCYWTGVASDGVLIPTTSPAELIDALTAERDDARAKLKSAEREISCLQGNLRDLQEENAHTKEHANRWEKRCQETRAKLDAIIAMLEPGGMPYDGCEPTDDQYIIEEWHIKKDLHARAVAIREGREGK